MKSTGKGETNTTEITKIVDKYTRDRLDNKITAYDNEVTRLSEESNKRLTELITNKLTDSQTLANVSYKAHLKELNDLLERYNAKLTSNQATNDTRFDTLEAAYNSLDSRQTSTEEHLLAVMPEPGFLKEANGSHQLATKSYISKQIAELQEKNDVKKR